MINFTAHILNCGATDGNPTYDLVTTHLLSKYLVKYSNISRNKIPGTPNQAFWDKSDSKETLVIATHGFIKKVDKVPENEISRAVRLKDEYFENKTKS
ncbi:MAG: hypothetical protein ACM3ME_09660 [Chloroflexota bacterium]